MYSWICLVVLTLTNNACWILSCLVSNFIGTVTLMFFLFCFCFLFFHFRKGVSTLVHQLALLKHPNTKEWLVHIGCLSFAFVTLKTRRKLGRLNFHKDFWDCYQGLGNNSPIADGRVPSNNPRNNCGTHLGSSFLVVSKVAIGGWTGRFTSWILNGMKNSGLVNFISESCLLFAQISSIYL